MNRIISRACLVLLLGSLSVAAQRSETSAERAFKRKALVEKLAKRASEDKQNATAWAKARGLPMRVDNGVQVRELMAIHNGKPLYYKTLNANAAISTAANLVRNTSPYNLNGAGITVGVWDGGSVLTSHQEFNGRVVDKDSVASHYHATHVGGTIGASGVQSNAKGMAPSVSIDSYDWDNDRSEMENAAASAAGQSDKIYLSNHSYGIGVGWEGGSFEGYEEFGQYIVYARLIDEIIADNPYYLPFVSAGNDRNDGPGNDATYPDDGEYKGGYDTISYYAIAKNVMTVGAVNDAVSGSSRSLANATMSSFSSWGPADDGRIKPDIVANGVGLYSCLNTSDSAYDSFSGTSMSSPNACGSAALLVEYYKELFSGGAMRASTLKGLIIHTADDLGNAGPDYQFGWGLMNTFAAAELLKDRVDNSIRLTEDAVSTSQRSDTYTFFSDGNEPVRVTLCWTDPAGASTTADDSRIARLINDLDLKVDGPNGTVWPYKLDYANPSANATTGENNIDNVEQVYVATPSAGQYTVTVNYDGPLSGGTQWYSLLISGPGSDSDADGMPNSWESEYFGGSTNAVASGDADGDGADNLTEYISGYDPTNSGSVFEVTNFTAPPSGSAPFILVWNPVEGRIYNVQWSTDLVFSPFTTIGANLPYTQNSYTDTVERTGLQNFYRVDVRLDQ